MKRYEAIKSIAPLVTEDMLCVMGLGNVSLEWETLRPSDGNIYNVSMGQKTPLGLGLALALPHRRVIVFQGDGSILLNLGALTELAWIKPKNIIDVVFDNGCYESTMGMPTPTATVTDLAAMAKGAGIEKAFRVDNVDDFRSLFEKALRENDLYFIVAKVEKGTARVTARRPYEYSEGIMKFVRYIERTEKINIVPFSRAFIERGWVSETQRQE